MSATPDLGLPADLPAPLDRDTLIEHAAALAQAHAGPQPTEAQRAACDFEIHQPDGKVVPCVVYDIFAVADKSYMLYAPIGTDDGQVVGVFPNDELYTLTDPDERAAVIAELERRSTAEAEEVDAFELAEEVAL